MNRIMDVNNILIKHKWKIAFVLLAVISFISIFIYLFTINTVFFDSDTATANLLAREQIRTHSLFPTNWYYGQDIWLFTINLPIVLLSFFMNNQILMRVIAVIIFIIIALISTILFHFKVTKDNSWIISIPLLFCGYSYIYDSMVFGQAAYLTVIPLMFFSFSLFSVSINDQFKVVNIKSLIGLLILIVVLGVSGLRMIQEISLPLLGTIMVVFFIENRNKIDETLKNNTKRMIELVLFFILAISIGVFVFWFVKNNVRYISGGTDPTYVAINSYDSIINNCMMIFQNYLCLLGFTGNIKVFSIQGVINAIKVLSFLFIVLIFPIRLIMNYKIEKFTVKLFIVYSITHNLFLLYLFVFCNYFMSEQALSRYLITSLFLTIIMSAYYIYHYLLNKEILIKVVVTLGVSAVVFSSTYQTFQFSKGYHNELKYKYAVVNFLEENNLHNGYATYWNAGVNTVLSDFNVEIIAINVDQNEITPFRWLSSESWYDNNYFIGSSFIMLTDEENKIFPSQKMSLLIGNPVETLYINNYVIYVYNYNIAQKAWVKAIK